MEYFAREVRHTVLALMLALLVAASAALVEADSFAPVLTVGFAVTLVRTAVTVLITALTRIMDKKTS